MENYENSSKSDLDIIADFLPFVGASMCVEDEDKRHRTYWS
jgi:hypothetical protein